MRAPFNTHLFPSKDITLEDPNLARIYVVRPTHFGSAIPISINDGGKEIGQTGSNTFLCWERKPEEVSLTSEAENDSCLILDVKAGEIYYIQQHIRGISLCA